MKSNTKKIPDVNRLFPIFIKLEDLNVLIVGGGKVATEKLTAILANSPSASIKIVSKAFSSSLKKAAALGNVVLFKKNFEPGDLRGVDIVFSAVNDPGTSKLIATWAKKLRVLHNAADKPELCDFYLGSIVQKGNLKLGISTNGKSPTLAKRLKSILEQSIPAEIDVALNNLAIIRTRLKGDLKQKSEQLNAITSVLVVESSTLKSAGRKGTRKKK
jgi:siroheme synthase-like protein